MKDSKGFKKLKFDYIFLSDNIEIKNKILPINFLDFEKGLPNENFPSDHIYLFMEFKFCDKNKEIIFNFDKIVYDKKLNYELNMENDTTKNDKENKENEESIKIKDKNEHDDDLNKNNNN